MSKNNNESNPNEDDKETSVPDFRKGVLEESNNVSSESTEEMATSSQKEAPDTEMDLPLEVTENLSESIDDDDTEDISKAVPTKNDVLKSFECLRESHLKNGDLSKKDRKKYLKKLKKALAQNREKILSTLDDDYQGRSHFQSLAVDYFSPMIAIKNVLNHIDNWMETERAESFWIFWPSSSEIHYCAKGVVGIIAPWNYPFYLSLVPLIGAISAGNRIILKPSEYTLKSSQLLADILNSVFPEDVVQIVQGEADVAISLTNLPLDHLFFTGSSAIGKHVMRAASKNLVPVTLELGGKSPVLIHPSYSIKKAVKSVIDGKMFNSGQSCFAPDYVLCPTGQENQLVSCIENQVTKFFPTINSNNDYTAIVNEQHLSRLNNLLEDASSKGAKVIEINPNREVLKNKMAFHVVLNPTDDMLVMQEEIFGLILPVVSYNNLEQAIDYINRRPSPLCLYYFDKKRSRIKKVIQTVRAGGVTINETFYHIAQEELPFGGFGNSGMGGYHGWHSFIEFSHRKAVFHHSSFSIVPSVLKPPYKKLSALILRFLAWW